MGRGVDSDRAHKASLKTSVNQPAVPQSVVASPVSAPHALQRMSAGVAFAPDALALQQAAGNRATAAMMPTSASVQRKVQVDEGLDQGGGALDTVSGQIGQWGGAAQFGTMPNAQGVDDNAYKYGNTTSPGAQSGEASGILGGLAAIGGTVLSSKNAIEAQGVKKTETEQNRGGQATWKEADRTHGTNAVNATQSALSVPAQVLTTVSGFSQVAANAGSSSAFASMNNLLGGIGGIIALPIAALTTLRTMRKAYKQYGRVKKLQKGMADPNASVSEATRKLADLEQLVTEAEALKSSADDDVSASEQSIARLYDTDEKKATPEYRQAMNLLDLERILATQFASSAREAVVNRDKGAEAKQKAEEAITAAATRLRTEQENPDDIRAYALRKNQSGFMKKIISTVGGVIGIGGGIAATIASFAAIGATTVVATATLATPVGWALCGVAALIGLGLAGRSFWKWASKRYDRAQNAGKSKFKSFLHAINPFSKKVGVSKRERLAERLYTYANDPTNADEQKKAKETLAALGLDFDQLHMGEAHHKAASLKLIAAKMGS